jgi:hypothetical protein
VNETRQQQEILPINLLSVFRQEWIPSEKN